MGAEDFGEELITEEIFHDRAGEWPKDTKFGRIRKTKKGTIFTYKHVQDRTATGILEIEFEIKEPKKLRVFLEEIGLVMNRENEKYRHKFKLREVIIDIDTWPKIPTYVELEGPSEEAIKNTAAQLGFDWSKGVFGTAAQVIEEVYKIPVKNLRYFTFSRLE